MRRVLLAINLLRSYNEVAHDERFCAVIDIIESIVRDEVKDINPGNSRVAQMTQTQRDMLRAAMDNLHVNAIQFEDGEPIRREDLDKLNESNDIL